MLREILQNYRTLCLYCDRFFDAALRDHPEHINCKPGCGSCCELESVNYLEAFAISTALQSSNISLETNHSGCVFLTDNRCRIYSSRPIICRTHGLLLKSNDQTGSPAASCLHNYKQQSLRISSRFVLDTDSVTLNLIRLNMAFCILLGDPDAGSKRIYLNDISIGILPGKIADLISEYHNGN